jgi:hypothetical protein
MITINNVFLGLKNSNYIKILLTLLIFYWLLFYNIFPDHGNLRSEAYLDYEPQVKALMNNGSFLDAKGTFLDSYPPIFPIFIYLSKQLSAFINFDLKYINFFTNAILILFTMYLSYSICKLYFSKQSSILISLLIGAHPHLTYSLIKPISVTLFLPFFLISLFHFIKIFKSLNEEKTIGFLHPIICGIFLGLSALVRPTPVFLPIVFFFIFSYFSTKNVKIKAKLIYPSIIFLSFIFTLLPWEYLIYKYNNKFVLISSIGHNSLRWSFKINYIDYESKVQISDDLSEFNNRGIEKVHSSSDYFSFLFQELKTNPFTVAEYFAFNAIRQWYGTYAQRSEIEKINKIIAVIFLAVYFSTTYVYFSTRCGDKYFYIISSMMLYFWLIAVPAHAIVRYMIPTYVFMIMSYGYLFDYCFGEILYTYKSGKE